MKDKNLENRIDKINLLKDLQAGRTTIQKLTMAEIATYYKNKEGLYSTFGFDGNMTEAEYKAHIKAHPAKRVITWVYQQGNEPLED